MRLGLAISLVSTTALFSPAALFAASQPGIWLDPSDLTTLFQDTAGTQPVTTPGQTVALALDKSRGLVLGSELRGTGDVTTIGSPGTLGTYNTSTGAGSAYRLDGSNVSGVRIVVPDGRFYLIDVEQLTGSLQIRGTGLAGNLLVTSVSGRQTYRILVGSGEDLFFTTGVNASTTTFIIHSVRELAGNHATQATPASRPTFGTVPSRGRVNLLTFTEQFSTAAWSLVNVSGTASRTGNVLTFGANASDRFVQSNNVLTAAQHTASITLSGTGEVRLYLLGGDGSTGAPTTVTLTATPTRYTITRTPAGGGSFGGIGIYNNAAGTATTVTISEPQVELGSTATPYQKVVSQFDVTDPAGFPSYPLYYLSFDGIDDFLITPTITPNIDKAQVFAGVRKLSDAAGGTIAEHSLSGGGGAGSIGLFAPSPTAGEFYRLSTRGSASTVNVVATSSIFSAPITNVLTGIGDIAGDNATLRINGTQAAQSTADQGTGNFLAYPLYIGRRGGTSLPFNGQIYSLIVRFGANLDAGTIASTERWVGQKTGVTIA